MHLTAHCYHSYYYITLYHSYCYCYVYEVFRFREDAVRESPTVRNLGVLFDKYLLWDSHVSDLVKKCNGILIGLTHVRHQISSSLLTIIVDALVLSRVRLSLAVFGNGSENNTQCLQKVFSFCLRAVSGKKIDHISDVLEVISESDCPRPTELYESQFLNFLHKEVVFFNLRHPVLRCCTGEPQDVSPHLSVDTQLRSRLEVQSFVTALPACR